MITSALLLTVNIIITFHFIVELFNYMVKFCLYILICRFFNLFYRFLNVVDKVNCWYEVKDGFIRVKNILRT